MEVPSIPANMQFLLQRHLLGVTLFPLLLLVCCHPKSDNTSKDIDSFSKSLQLEPGLDTVQLKQGESLFKTNCNNCHGIFKTDNILQGVIQRVNDNYFKLYLTKQDSLIKAKDKYALKLKEVFRQQKNIHSFNFSDAQLNAIIAYIKKNSS